MPTLDVRQVLLCILLCGVIGNAADSKGGSKLRKVLLPNNGIVSFIEQGPADGPALIIISTSTAFSSAVPSADGFLGGRLLGRLDPELRVLVCLLPAVPPGNSTHGPSSDVSSVSLDNPPADGSADLNANDTAGAGSAMNVNSTDKISAPATVSDIASPPTSASASTFPATFSNSSPPISDIASTFPATFSNSSTSTSLPQTTSIASDFLFATASVIAASAACDERAIMLLASTVRAFAAALSLRRFSLVGQGTGAAVAMYIANYWPQHVRRLVIINACTTPRDACMDRAAIGNIASPVLLISKEEGAIFEPDRCVAQLRRRLLVQKSVQLDCEAARDFLFECAVGVAAGLNAFANASVAPPLMFDGFDELPGLSIQTEVVAAQEAFDAGLRLCLSFDFVRASEYFEHCHRLDPDAAMCLWGAAFSLGQNLNAPANLVWYARAYVAATRGRELAKRRLANALNAERAGGSVVQTALVMATAVGTATATTTATGAPSLDDRARVVGAADKGAALRADGRQAAAATEQANQTLQRLQLEVELLEAVCARYPSAAPSEAVINPSNVAYARAMVAVATAQPDPIILYLAADANMNIAPWDYWLPDKVSLKPHGAAAQRMLLQAVAVEDPHPGALHLLVHLYEASEIAVAARPYASMLRGRVHGSPHLLHMPSHIDMRDGDYASSVRSNAMAVALPLCRHAYPQHNMESLLWSARMADDLEVSLDVAKQLAAHATATCHARVDEAGMSCERFTSQLLLTLVHFEMWDDIQMKHRGPPPSEFRYWRAVWLFAQGMAATRGSGSTRHADTTSGMPNLDQAGRMIAASRWLALLQSQRGEVERAPAAWTYASLVQLVAIYEHVLRAEIMLLDEIRTAKDAVAELEMALLQQTLIPYDEPPALYRSVRPRLADILMRLNDTNSARAILRAELYEYPNQPFLAAKCARLGPPRCGGGAEQLVAESHADVSPRVLHLRVFPICIALVTIFLLVLSLCAVFLDKADWVPSGDRHTPSLLSSARGTALC